LNRLDVVEPCDPLISFIAHTLDEATFLHSMPATGTIPAIRVLRPLFVGTLGVMPSAMTAASSLRVWNPTAAPPFGDDADGLDRNRADPVFVITDEPALDTPDRAGWAIRINSFCVSLNRNCCEDYVTGYIDAPACELTFVERLDRASADCEANGPGDCACKGLEHCLAWAERTTCDPDNLSEPSVLFVPQSCFGHGPRPRRRVLRQPARRRLPVGTDRVSPRRMRLARPPRTTTDARVLRVSAGTPRRGLRRHAGYRTLPSSPAYCGAWTEKVSWYCSLASAAGGTCRKYCVPRKTGGATAAGRPR
jgi:hypothetical protein